MNTKELCELANSYAHLKQSGLERKLKASITVCNPVGFGNSKLGIASTYRPIGKTCPTTCPWFDNGCYGQGGKCNMHQRRSQDCPKASTTAFVIGALVSAYHTQAPVRLHVTGDIYSNGKIDTVYVESLIQACNDLRQYCQVPLPTVLAYGYTAGVENELESVVASLHAVGIRIRYSNRLDANSTYVYPHSEIDELRKQTTTPLVPCLVQVGKRETCATCKVCWQASKACVVFDPHGIKAKSMRKRIVNKVA